MVHITVNISSKCLGRNKTKVTSVFYCCCALLSEPCVCCLVNFLTRFGDSWFQIHFSFGNPISFPSFKYKKKKSRSLVFKDTFSRKLSTSRFQMYLPTPLSLKNVLVLLVHRESQNVSEFKAHFFAGYCLLSNSVSLLWNSYFILPAMIISHKQSEESKRSSFKGTFDERLGAPRFRIHFLTNLFCSVQVLSSDLFIAEKIIHSKLISSLCAISFQIPFHSSGKLSSSKSNRHPQTEWGLQTISFQRHFWVTIEYSSFSSSLSHQFTRIIPSIPSAPEKVIQLSFHFQNTFLLRRLSCSKKSKQIFQRDFCMGID